MMDFKNNIFNSFLDYWAFFDLNSFFTTGNIIFEATNMFLIDFRLINGVKTYEATGGKIIRNLSLYRAGRKCKAADQMSLPLLLSAIVQLKEVPPYLY